MPPRGVEQFLMSINVVGFTHAGGVGDAAFQNESDLAGVPMHVPPLHDRGEIVFQPLVYLQEPAGIGSGPHDNAGQGQNPSRIENAPVAEYWQIIPVFFVACRRFPLGGFPPRNPGSQPPHQRVGCGRCGGGFWVVNPLILPPTAHPVEGFATVRLPCFPPPPELPGQKRQPPYHGSCKKIPVGVGNVGEVEGNIAAAEHPAGESNDAHGGGDAGGCGPGDAEARNPVHYHSGQNEGGNSDHQSVLG